LAASCAVASIGSFRPRYRAAFLLLVGLLVSSGRLQADDLVVDTGSTTNITSGANLYVNATIGLTTSNNQLNVLNAGTLVSASGLFSVGAGGSSNSLVISNDGSVSAGALTVSAGPGTNSVVVSSGSLQVAGTLNVGATGKGTLQVQGGLVTAGNLVATNYGNGSFLINSVILLNGGELSAGGATISNGIDFFIGDANGATSATYLANGGTHSFGARVLLGRSSGNRLFVTSGASLTNSAGLIGFGPGASSNSAVVEGTNSAWNNAGDLQVGNEGSSNSLVISNSGSVQSVNGFVGFTNSSSGNNVLVTGASSTWTLANNLYIGNGGSGNSVVISNGGSLAGDSGWGGSLVIGNNTNSTNNSLAVTDSGLVYYGQAVYVGSDGSGNSMTIGSGGTVASEFGVYLGWGNNSSNNIVTVTNGGGLATTTEQSGIYFAIGNGGSANSLVISNGGSVHSLSDSAIGNNTNSANNRVLVTGAASTWTNRGNLFVGNNGSGNSLVISNGGSVVVSSLALYDGYIGNGGNSSGNSVLVTGTGSSLSIPNNLHVGYAGQGNSLTVANGGELAPGTALKIATQSGSSGTLNIGSYGGNDAAGNVMCDQIEFGAGAGAINFNQTNAVTLGGGFFGNGIIRQLGTGTTTIYNEGGQFGGALEVLAGTLVMSNASDPSISAGASNIVVGAGGTLQAAGPWGISIALNPGTSGVLDLNGGNVSGPINFGAGTGTVNFNQTNAVTNASAFSGSGTIAQLGTGTTTLTGIQTNFTGSLFVSAGTLVLKPEGPFAPFPLALGGTNIMVTGGARLRGGEDQLFMLGYTNNGSRLVISNGGGLESPGGTAIGSTNSLDNSWLVTGPGSTWTNTGDLLFGNESSGNSLVISNGGRVANRGTGYTTCFVGYSESSPVTKTSNNSVLVTGINSTWDIEGILGVGGYGHGNSVVISNGGSVLSQQGGVGLGNNPDLNSSNNSVLVTGAGSMWSNSLTLRVESGGGNSLTVANGGSVYAPAGIIIEGESTTFDDPGGALNIGRLGTNDAGGTITGAIQLGGTGALLNFNQSNTAVVGNLITGTGNLRQLGTGVTILTASNAFNGSVSVLGGTLRLQSATGSALGSVFDITVTNGTLVLAANSQIKTNAGVTLSRGTLVLGDGVAQSLSSLTTTNNNASTLDFGASGVSSLNFGNYQPQTFFRLKLQNFAAGDSFTFTLPNYQIHSFSDYFEIVGDYVGHTTQTGQDTYNVISLGTQQYVDWTHSYGLDPVSSTGATAGTPAADPDGDGFDNNEEYAFGGNPRVGTPALLVMASSNVSFIGLKSAPSGYIVQNTTNLSTGPWTNYPVVMSNTAPPFPIPQPESYQGMGFTVPLTPGTNNFYRVIFSNQ